MAEQKATMYGAELEEIGAKFESFVGECLERHCNVLYSGQLFGKFDMGIDLLSVKDGILQISQCKCWKRHAVIYAPEILKFFGAILWFHKEFNITCETRYVFYYTCDIEPYAKKVARSLGIQTRKWAFPKNRSFECRPALETDEKLRVAQIEHWLKEQDLPAKANYSVELNKLCSEEMLLSFGTVVRDLESRFSRLVTKYNSTLVRIHQLQDECNEKDDIISKNVETIIEMDRMMSAIRKEKEAVTEESGIIKNHNRTLKRLLIVASLFIIALMTFTFLTITSM